MSPVSKLPVVLLGRMYHPQGEERLRAEVPVEILEKPTPENVVAALRTASGVFVRYPNRLKAKAIAGAEHLRIISASGRGTDAIDLEAATARGIPVVNQPAFGIVPVTEHTIGVMIAFAKNLLPLNRLTHAGKGWPAQKDYRRTELRGKTLGVIGLGNIGEEIARCCTQAFRMRVLAYDPYVPAAKAVRVGAEWTSDLGRIWRESDFVSVHAELTEETRGMVGESELRAMQPHAILINTARGPIVQAKALADALREHRIAGASLDVYEDEPFSADSPLAGLENVILSPHTGGLTEEALHGMALSAADQILQALRGERPPHVVNPQVWR
ncbi:MAG: hydroxyacid dehydrogenase [Betaproteobacteria bacterium]|nr:hydroxyacid dehydrogenase [Betaproteobacteria bacterium]